MSKVKAGPILADRLKSFIERIEKLIEERRSIGDDIRDVFSEAKGVGYDVGTMRKVIKIRAMDASDRAEQETLLDTYLHALGMVDRIEARAAAGESARQIAAAEGVSKSTAARVSQKSKSKNERAEMGQPDHDPETGEVIEPGGALAAAESERPAPAPETGVPPVSPAAVTSTPEHPAGQAGAAADVPAGVDTGSAVRTGSNASSPAVPFHGNTTTQPEGEGEEASGTFFDGETTRALVAECAKSNALIAAAIADDPDWDAINATQPAQLRRGKEAAV